MQLMFMSYYVYHSCIYIFFLLILISPLLLHAYFSNPYYILGANIQTFENILSTFGQYIVNYFN